MKNIFTTLIVIAAFNAAMAQTADTWLQKADFPDAPVISTIAFTIGDTIYYGGGYNYNTCTNDFWKYIPANNAWVQVTGMGGGNRTGAVSFSVNGKAYVAMGTDCNFLSYQDVWQYDPTGDQWTQRSDFPGDSRRFAAAFAINGKGYVATGSGSSIHKDIWEYNPTTDQWTQKADMPVAGRCNASAFVIGNTAYIGLGYDGTNDLLDFWAYNPATNTWTQKANYQGTAVSNAMSFSIGGHGYCGMGATLTTNKRDFWEYDTAADAWTQRAYPGVALAAGSGVSANGVGYFIGGQDSTSNYQNSTLQYTPITTGVTTLQANAQNVSVYPNPCTGYVTCKNLPVSNSIQLDIYDALGNKLLSQKCNSTEYTLTLTDVFSKGVYTLRVTSDNAEPLSYKVVKE